MKTRDGTAADELLYLKVMDYGQDTNHTFTFAGLVVFTSENVLENHSPGNFNETSAFVQQKVDSKMCCELVE